MSKTRIYSVVTILVIASIAALTLKAQSDDNDRVLHGSFLGTVTVNQTGRVFKALDTFAPGGGVIETFYNRTGALTILQGTWRSTGDREFTITSDGLGPDVTLPSGQTVSFVAGQLQHRLTLDPSGNSFDTVWVDRFFDASGNVVRTATGTVHATRIVAD